MRLTMSRHPSHVSPKAGEPKTFLSASSSRLSTRPLRPSPPSFPSKRVYYVPGTPLSMGRRRRFFDQQPGPLVPRPAASRLETNVHHPSSPFAIFLRWVFDRQISRRSSDVIASSLLSPEASPSKKRELRKFLRTHLLRSFFWIDSTLEDPQTLIEPPRFSMRQIDPAVGLNRHPGLLSSPPSYPPCFPIDRRNRVTLDSRMLGVLFLSAMLGACR